MSAATGRFRPSDRLLTGRQFERVLRNGVRATAGPLVVTLAVDEGKKPRLGLTVGRKVGNAVVRNRLKRRIREWFRARRGRLAEPLDIVVIGRSGAGTLSSRALSQHLDTALERAAGKLA